MVRKFFFVLTAAAACLQWTGNALAQDGDRIETPKVTVTATKVEKEIEDVPASVSIITEEDIKKSPARTVGELLQDVPGIQVVNSGGQGLKRISMRGEGVNRTLVLIDGQQIVENKSMEGSALMIDPSMIERIEVTKGPSSVLYGSNAIGGVINIITKKGGGKPFQGDVSASFNGASSGFAEAASLYGSAGGFEYRISASYNDQKKLRTPLGLAPNTSFSQGNYGAYLAYNISEDYKVGLSYDYFKADIMSGSQAAGYENFYVDIPEWQRQKAAAFFEGKNLASFMPRLRADLFWQENRKKMRNHVDIDPNVVYMPMILDNYADNVNGQWGLSIQSDWAAGDHTYIIAGYDFAYNTLDADTEADTSSQFSLTYYNKKSKNKGYEYSHALYAQGESYLPLDFTLNYGVRWTYNYSNMTKAEGVQIYKDGTIPPKILGPDDLGAVGDFSSNAPVFSAGIMWQGIENLTVRFNFSQGFRSPTLQEKYLISSMGGGTIYPNPNLKPEKSNNFELGFRYGGYGVNMDAVYFLSLADNYIAQEPVSSGSNTTRYKNVSSALTHGAELALSYESPLSLKPYASVTVMQRRYEDAGKTTWKTGVPLVSGRAGLIYSHSFRNAADFKIDLFSRFASETEDTLDTVHAEYNGYLKYSSWATANIAMGVDFGEKRQYSLSAEVNNIFNKLYQTSVDIYEPGVFASVKFAARF